MKGKKLTWNPLLVKKNLHWNDSLWIRDQVCDKPFSKSGPIMFNTIENLRFVFFFFAVAATKQAKFFLCFWLSFAVEGESVSKLR